jgi:hypothetical protein
LIAPQGLNSAMTRLAVSVAVRATLDKGDHETKLNRAIQLGFTSVPANWLQHQPEGARR